MKSPFKFLDAYTLQDKDIFFGRNAEIEEIYDKIYKSDLFVLYGSSGTGKTSLIQCGLGNKIPSTDWLPIFIRREQHILQAIQSQFHNIAITKIYASKLDGTSLIENIRSVYLDYFKPIYLIFDQFEELFISGIENEKTDFFNFLKLLLESDLQVKIVLSIREEYLAQLTIMEKAIPKLFENRMRIENMTPQKITTVIKESCESFNIPIEDTAIPDSIFTALVNKEGVVELPHLQVYLDRLYRTSTTNSSRPHFTQSLINQTGNIDDVLATFLNEQVALLAHPKIGWQLLKFFITDKGTKKTVSHKDWETYIKQHPNISKTLQQSKEKLIEQRVIRYRDQENTMELSHDSLALRVFENLSQEERQLIEVKNFLTASYQNHLINGSFLNMSDIPFIEPYIQKMAVSKPIVTFFNKSKQKAKRKKLIQVITVFSIIVVLSAITIFSVIQSGKAKKAKEEAELALKNFNSEKDKNTRTQIKQLFETIEAYNKAGYHNNAKILLDSIKKMNGILKDKTIENQLKTYE